MQIGKKAQITQFAETPLEGVNQILKIVNQPIPDIKTLGDTDVLIEVKSSADWLGRFTNDKWAISTSTASPLYTWFRILWRSAMDRSAAVETDKLKIGDKVMVDGFISGPRSPGKYQQYGGFATYAVAPIEAIIPMPKRLSFDQACNLLGQL